jgi:hypothetical protein
MKVLFNDIAQMSDAPASMKTPALADRHPVSGPVTVTFDFPRYVDAVGIGFTDARVIRLTWETADELALDNQFAGTPESGFEAEISGGSPQDMPLDFGFEFSPVFPARIHKRNEAVVNYYGDGLYEVPPVIASAVTVECAGGTYIGRFGAGRGVPLGTGLAKEPSFNTTEENRKTLSGQIIPGAGGYNYRSVGLDTRYKIGGEAMREIKAAYHGQIAKGFPFFLLFDTEVNRLPFYRMYAKDKSAERFGFESGAHGRYLFSRKFEFEECF